MAESSDSGGCARGDIPYTPGNFWLMALSPRSAHSDWSAGVADYTPGDVVCVPIRGLAGRIFSLWNCLSVIILGSSTGRIRVIHRLGYETSWLGAETGYSGFYSQCDIVSFLLTGFAVRSRVIGADLQHPAWGGSNRSYVEIENGLRLAGADKDGARFINNPPGYFVATGRPALAIPDGDLNSTLLVAKKYGGAYLILEYNHPLGLDELYQTPIDHPGIKYLTTISGAHYSGL